MRFAPTLLCAALLVSTEARASSAEPYDKHPLPTLYWMLAQGMPSPEFGFGGSGSQVAAGMRWQVTPILYSFGLYRKLSPWRAFVVEPLTRQSGSIELFLSPEFLTANTSEWIARVGVHTTLPLLERGERLALTFGGGVHGGAEVGAFFEGGFSAFVGTVGLFFSYAPRLSLAPATVMLRFRFF